jgi:hypothetical protein
VRQRLNINVRRQRLALQLLARENHRLAVLEHLCCAGFLVDRRFKALVDISRIVGEI